MPAAIAVPAIIGAASTAAQMYGAHKASSAAKQAADQQSASADKAQAFNQQVYNDQRTMMQPYVTGGQSAFGSLLSGWQAKQPGGAPAPGPAPRPSAFGQAFGAPQPQQAAPQQPPMGGGAMVSLRAPDGSVQDVPEQLAGQFIAKGAQRVS